MEKEESEFGDAMDRASEAQEKKEAAHQEQADKEEKEEDQAEAAMDEKDAATDEKDDDDDDSNTFSRYSGPGAKNSLSPGHDGYAAKGFRKKRGVTLKGSASLIE